MATEAQHRASKKWNSSRDNIMIRPEKAEGQTIREAAAAAGMSVQAYILQAVRNQMEKELNPFEMEENLKVNHGAVNFEGKLLALTEEAYPTNYRDRVRYEAHAVDGQGNKYTVQWETTDEWDAATEAAKNDPNDAPALLDDESNACDWDNPVAVTEC